MPAPLYFAWVNPGQTTFTDAMKREDAKVLSFELTQSEGDFATLTIEIENPRIGLLSPGRKRWLWFAWESGSSPGTIPLFFGSLVGVPQEMDNNTVRLSFIARPRNYDAQKRTLAETLKALPFYDPVWLTPEERSNPDAVLDARSAAWHVDRTTLELSVSDIITGEDGRLFFGGADIFDLSITYGQQALRTVRVEAEVSWSQDAAGEVDLTKRLIRAFKDAGSSIPHNVTSFTGQGLYEDWPKPDVSIGGGWKVGLSSVERGEGRWAPDVAERTTTGTATLNEFDGTFRLNLVIDPQQSVESYFRLFSMVPVFTVTYETRRARIETLAFELSGDVQALLNDPGEEEVFLLTLASRDVAESIDPSPGTSGEGDPPIGDKRRPSYFQTARGKRSIRNLIARARAILLYRARTVTVAIETDFLSGTDFSLRKNVTVRDERLPGGEARGKIISYTLACDGSTGKLTAVCSIGVAIGDINAGQSPSTGVPTYVDEGYVDEGYQRYRQVIEPLDGGDGSVSDVSLFHDSIDEQELDDDGVDFFRMKPRRVIDSLTIINGERIQKQVLAQHFADIPDAIKTINAAYTEVDLNLIPVTGGPFQTPFNAQVSDLTIPQGIDLLSEDNT